MRSCRARSARWSWPPALSLQRRPSRTRGRCSRAGQQRTYEQRSSRGRFNSFNNSSSSSSFFFSFFFFFFRCARSVRARHECSTRAEYICM